MTRKQTAIVIVLALVVLGGLAVGILMRNGRIGPSPLANPNAGGNGSSASSTLETKGFVPTVPANATATPPQKSIPIVNQPSAAPGASYETFSVVASANGYSPAAITVKSGDTVEIDLSAQGGGFDIFSRTAGFYASASPGKPGKISFSAATPGTFLFECRDLCPSGGKISGELIVLPK